MKNDMKEDIFFTVLAVSFFGCMAVIGYSKSNNERIVAETAIKNGYVQCNINHSILWKKSCEE